MALEIGKVGVSRGAGVAALPKTLDGAVSLLTLALSGESDAGLVRALLAAERVAANAPIDVDSAASLSLFAQLLDLRAKAEARLAFEHLPAPRVDEVDGALLRQLETAAVSDEGPLREVIEAACRRLFSAQHDERLSDALLCRLGPAVSRRLADVRLGRG